MPRSVFISPADKDLRTKLGLLSQFDPIASGGAKIVPAAASGAKDAAHLRLLGDGYEAAIEIDPGFCLVIFDGYIARDWSVTTRSKENCLRLRIAFAGEATYFGGGGGILDQTSRCSYIVQPTGENVTADIGSSRYRFCALHIAENYLRNRWGMSTRQLPRQLATHWRNKELAFGYITLNRAALALAARLFSLKSEEPWRSMETSAIAIDLLHSIFMVWRSGDGKTETVVRLKPEERSALAKLKSIAEERISHPISLDEAIDITGLDKNKVHFGFKRLFGASLHDFCTTKRMEAAMTMLKESKLPIFKIAEFVGYSEPTNFTSAFKKHFSMLPSTARRQNQARTRE